jgi:UDPglucose 6-dehydrogenase
MIGIIGYGFVGQAVVSGFSKTPHIVSDPAVNTVTISDVCAANPEAIFVCVPTPTDGSNYAILRAVLTEIQCLKYTGLTVVKSTVLPGYLSEFDVILNPEFLSRKTALTDFTNPPLVLFGGDRDKTAQLFEIYRKYSTVDLTNIKFTDIKTAALAKYTFNAFYATKLTFMNQIYDVAIEEGIDFEELKSVLKMNPWMGVNHLDVPGWEGRGFSGPCLPKDTEALSREYDIKLLQTVLELNDQYRRN